MQRFFNAMKQANEAWPDSVNQAFNDLFSNALLTALSNAIVITMVGDSSSITDSRILGRRVVGILVNSSNVGVGLFTQSDAEDFNGATIRGDTILRLDGGLFSDGEQITLFFA